MISSNLSGITKGVTKKSRNLLSFPYLHLGINLMKSMESVCGILLTKGSGKSSYYIEITLNFRMASHMLVFNPCMNIHAPPLFVITVNVLSSGYT